MGLYDKDITKKSTVLVGFSGEAQQTIGEIMLSTLAKGVDLPTKFNVVDCPSAYNIILGTLWIHKMKEVPSTYHQTLKFPTKWGVKEIKSEQKAARECYSSSLKPPKASIQQLKNGSEPDTPDEENVDEVVLDPTFQIVSSAYIGATLSLDTHEQVTNLLKTNQDLFAWAYEEMTGISLDVITHKLNVDPEHKLVKQK